MVCTLGSQNIIHACSGFIVPCGPCPTTHCSRLGFTGICTLSWSNIDAHVARWCLGSATSRLWDVNNFTRLIRLVVQMSLVASSTISSATGSSSSAAETLLQVGYHSVVYQSLCWETQIVSTKCILIIRVIGT